ncbi:MULTISPECIES: aconitase/3-isopropylmalate dehydratase large subunit family protein [unclassified Paenarthrobacter]|uniref:3-isopropylmalate dehydratase large subunit n=1 Tax=unclassified Paenarthrobacter TaxID=2634190 RepID=UPI001EED5D2C|nr:MULTISPECIES: aconitase/3-isopropylmalate dehydratase large subunit family protein [unclassified Paenarthrobacter]MCF3139953.1 3-isopropylmalate dehydratase large subunit [Paenarthrobacter sp. AR 02]MCR1162388.1 aconitase/3-isopropylmalate dehydratase large subunit family protein [Paenarthrobacter sp. UW852]
MSTPEPLVERIIDQHSDDAVTPGALVSVRVDRIYVQDGNSPTLARLFHKHGISSIREPEKVAFVFDHSVLAPNAAIADRMKEAAGFAKELGVQVMRRGDGISHVIAQEEGWFQPGTIVLGSDSHTCAGGANQSLALGMGVTDIAAAMISGETWLKVPETVWLNVVGTPHPLVRPKDVVLHILGTLGQAPFLYKSVEWIGPWAAALTEDGAASVASMGVEMGAKCVFLPPRRGRSSSVLSPVFAPDEANTITVDITGLDPVVALPHSPSQVASLSDVAGLSLDYVFIGSCTNSRLEDIEEAARMLDGKAVHPDVHMVVTPGSQRIMEDALRLGLIGILTRAGALVTPAGCGPCVGAQGPVPASGDRVLSTMNRNFKGRMGNGQAEIFLSSPLVAASSALLGRFPSIEELKA